MQLPLQITFRDFPSSEAVEARIRARVEKLERMFDSITACRVVVEAPHQHHHKGRIYSVSVDVTVPEDEIVVGRHGGANHAHEDVYVAIRDAFDALSRRLQERVDRARGDVKQHTLPRVPADTGGSESK
jgi:ribosomal subunit interface protein